MVVYLRGLCEFPVCWLDFGPYPSVCICTAAAAAPLLSVPAAFLSHIQEVGSTDWIEVRSSCPLKVTPC